MMHGQKNIKLKDGILLRMWTNEGCCEEGSEPCGCIKCEECLH